MLDSLRELLILENIDIANENRIGIHEFTEILGLKTIDYRLEILQDHKPKAFINCRQSVMSVEKFAYRVLGLLTGISLLVNDIRHVIVHAQVIIYRFI